MTRIKSMFFLPLLMLIAFSCEKQHSLEITPIKYGNVILTFSHNVNGSSLKFDTLLYRTSLGNRYMVTDLQYFISRVALHPLNGKNRLDVTTDDGIHYIDARNNYTCSWWVSDFFPARIYDTITFTFGLDVQQNISGRFVNPPQRDMFWPGILGGGYHYMKMNLKWKNDSMIQTLPFMFHIGIGQVYPPNSVNPDSIIGFVQNYFTVSLPCRLDLTTGGIHQVMLQMNVAQWFDGQNTFDFASYPMGIMQNQEGMFRACMNGKRAFSITIAN